MTQELPTTTATVAETTVVEAFCDACDEIAEVVLVDGLLLCEQCR